MCFNRKYNAFYVFGLLMLTVSLAFGQTQRDDKVKQSQNFAKKAGQALANGDFANAEANYRRAVAADPDNSVANYNFGNLYYGNKLKRESSDQLNKASKATKDKDLLHRVFHNQGNILMDKEQYAQAVEAYKNALRNDPTDDQTRYNLAVAKEKLKKKRKKQKKQNKKNKDKKDENKKKNKDKQNKNKKKNDKKKKDKGDKGNKDKKKKDDKKKGGKKKSDKKNKSDEKKENKKKKKGKSKKDKDKQKKKGKPEKTKGRLSKQQAKNLLKALKNQEEKTREKMNAKKTRGRKKTQEKDW